MLLLMRNLLIIAILLPLWLTVAVVALGLRFLLEPDDRIDDAPLLRR